VFSLRSNRLSCLFSKGRTRTGGLSFGNRSNTYLRHLFNLFTRSNRQHRSGEIALGFEPAL